MALNLGAESICRGGEGGGGWSIEIPATFIILDITKTESNQIVLLYIERILSFSRRHKMYVFKVCVNSSFLRFAQFFLFHVLSKQLLSHLCRLFVLCVSLSSTIFSMTCSVNKANLEVMFLLLHWWKATQNARTWHDYPKKSCTAVTRDMITRDLECPWHDYCIICSWMTSLRADDN